jgi:AsmA protein
VQLSGVGQTPQALAATLDGHAGLSMVNGTIDAALLQPLVAETLDAAGMPAPDVGNTSVRCLALRAEFSHGIASMPALSIDTPKLSLDGSGDIDFAAETFNLHLVPDLHAGPLAASAPVLLTGPFSAPKAALDRVGGRVGFSLGGAASGPLPSDCDAKLAIARGGAPGPMPAQATAPTQSLTLKKPKDLLKGLFH